MNHAASDGNAQPASQCRVDNFAIGEEEPGPFHPAVDASIPGWWRQELAFDSPHPRLPGTLSIQPQNQSPSGTVRGRHPGAGTNE